MLRCGSRSGTQRSLQDFLRPPPTAHDTQAATPSLPPAAPTSCKEANEIGYTSENLGSSHLSRH